MDWSTQQLVELLAAVSSYPDEASAARGGLERIAEAVDAEIAALVERGRVVTSLGFPAGRLPEAELVARVARPGDAGATEALGARTAVVPLAHIPDAAIVLARVGGDGFRREELSVLRAMARVLALSIETLRTFAAERARAAENSRLLASLQDRQRLLETSARIQRAISRRAPVDEVLAEIARGAAELIGDEVVGLRLVASDDPTRMRTVATVGVNADLVRALDDGRVGDGAGGRAIAENRLVVLEDYHESRDALPEFAADGLQAAMAAPVHERGAPIGSLVVASYRPGRRYTRLEHETLLAFAEHASLALMDAKLLDEIAHQALHDALTGLPNRALFLDRVLHALERSRRSDASLAVLFIDIDRFKDVNDTLGHDAGDALLVAFAQRVKSRISAADTPARLGGDEFAVLVEDLDDDDDALRIADRILDALEEPFAVGGRELSVRASIGVAGARSGPDLLRNADLAMYRAKTAGGGVKSFEPEMRRAVVARIGLETELRRAAPTGEGFLLHYQPIVELATGRIRSVEALLRWNHPERGLVAPAEFIGPAEASGAIVELGRWVLRQACSQLARWQRAHAAPLSVTVNFSGRQLDDPALVDDVARALAEAGLEPRCLTVELTETVLMRDAAPPLETLAALRKLGVHVAVDDFGTGYSSLSYLRQLPFDVLKIAKPFVDGIEHDANAAALAQVFVDLGRTFGVSVVAEGIESAGQLAQLERLGCELGQGFGLWRPLEAHSLDEVLRAEARRPGRSLRAVG